METNNKTSVMGFQLIGISNGPNIKSLLFLAFLSMYTETVLGNLLIIITVCVNHQLHSPMYFFLTNLSFVDICYISVTIPKLLDILLTNTNHISQAGCFSQLYFYLATVTTEFFLLTAMAYDRYVAICNPLRYQLVMSRKNCVFLSLTSWIIAFLDALCPIYIYKMSFCRSRKINHFFCDIVALIKLSCTDTYSLKVLIFLEGALFVMTSMVFILISYINIIMNILKMSSKESMHKAFSTCSSHITVVLLFYGTMISVYMRPYSKNADKFLSVLYVAVVPMVNPLIYSWRNRDLRSSLKKTLFHFCKFH